MEKNYPVPVDLMITENTNVLVITGPNTGGKTISLKTVGLASLMTKTGLYIVMLYYIIFSCQLFLLSAGIVFVQMKFNILDNQHPMYFNLFT